MGVLTADMRRVVEQQRLGFVATVCPDGTPNLSPKGTTAVWDDDHLIFANIRSPGTLANLRQNASVEVNVVDPFVRKGYRFKGVASIVESGPLYDKALAFYRERGSQFAIREIVMIQVQTAQPIDSPAYDLGLSEEEVRDRMVLPVASRWKDDATDRRVTRGAASRSNAAQQALAADGGWCDSEPPRLKPDVSGTSHFVTSFAIGSRTKHCDEPVDR